MLPITCILLEREEFEALACPVVFKTKAFYGDYASAPFQNETSSLMIWV